jgi:hypothetical protein
MVVAPHRPTVLVEHVHEDGVVLAERRRVRRDRETIGDVDRTADRHVRPAQGKRRRRHRTGIIDLA